MGAPVHTGAGAEAPGGKPLVPPTDLPDGYGRFAMFADRDGHTGGLWS